MGLLTYSKGLPSPTARICRRIKEAISTSTPWPAADPFIPMIRHHAGAAGDMRKARGRRVHQHLPTARIIWWERVALPGRPIRRLAPGVAASPKGADT